MSFTKKELECIAAVQRLSIRLGKVEKKIATRRMSVSKHKATMEKSVRLYNSEMDEKLSLENQLEHYRQILATSLQFTGVEPAAKQEPSVPISHYEIGREA